MNKSDENLRSTPLKVKSPSKNKTPERVVLRDISGGRNVTPKQDTPPKKSKSEQVTNLQFTREFVEDLVNDNTPKPDKPFNLPVLIVDREESDISSSSLESSSVPQSLYSLDSRRSAASSTYFSIGSSSPDLPDVVKPVSLKQKTENSDGSDYDTAPEDNVFEDNLNAVISVFENFNINTPQGKKLKHQLRKSLVYKEKDLNGSIQLARELNASTLFEKTLTSYSSENLEVTSVLESTLAEDNISDTQNTNEKLSDFNKIEERLVSPVEANNVLKSDICEPVLDISTRPAEVFGFVQQTFNEVATKLASEKLEYASTAEDTENVSNLTTSNDLADLTLEEKIELQQSVPIVAANSQVYDICENNETKLNDLEVLQEPLFINSLTQVLDETITKLNTVLQEETTIVEEEAITECLSQELLDNTKIISTQECVPIVPVDSQVYEVCENNETNANDLKLLKETLPINCVTKSLEETVAQEKSLLQEKNTIIEGEITECLSQALVDDAKIESQEAVLEKISLNDKEIEPKISIPEEENILLEGIISEEKHLLQKDVVSDKTVALQEDPLEQKIALLEQSLTEEIILEKRTIAEENAPEILSLSDKEVKPENEILSGENIVPQNILESFVNEKEIVSQERPLIEKFILPEIEIPAAQIIVPQEERVIQKEILSQKVSVTEKKSVENESVPQDYIENNLNLIEANLDLISGPVVENPSNTEILPDISSILNNLVDQASLEKVSTSFSSNVQEQLSVIDGAEKNTTIDIQPPIDRLKQDLTIFNTSSKSNSFCSERDISFNTDSLSSKLSDTVVHSIPVFNDKKQEKKLHEEEENISNESLDISKSVNEETDNPSNLNVTFESVGSDKLSSITINVTEKVIELANNKAFVSTITEDICPIGKSDEGVDTDKEIVEVSNEKLLEDGQRIIDTIISKGSYLEEIGTSISDKSENELLKGAEDNLNTIDAGLSFVSFSKSPQNKSLTNFNSSKLNKSSSKAHSKSSDSSKNNKSFEDLLELEASRVSEDIFNASKGIDDKDLNTMEEDIDYPNNDFDSIDPFKSKIKLGSSPPLNSNINTKENMNTKDNTFDFGHINPFQSNAKVGMSPPSSNSTNNYNCIFSPIPSSSNTKDIGKMSSPSVDSKLHVNKSPNSSQEFGNLSHIIGHDQSNDSVTNKVAPMKFESDKDFENMRIKSSMEAKKSVEKNFMPKNVDNTFRRSGAFGVQSFEPSDDFLQDNYFKSSEFDFLMNVGNSSENSNLARDSLFVKFDPLVGYQPLPTGPRTTSTTISANLPKENSLTHSLDSSTLDNSRNTSTQSRTNSSYRSALNMTDLQNKSGSHIITPITPPKNPALEAIDRLISLTPSPKEAPLPDPIPEPEPIKEESFKEDTEKMQYIEELKVLRELMTKQEEEFNRQIQELRHQVEVAENKEQTLIKRVADKTKLEQQMNVVMQEYERNIAQLIADGEHDKQLHEANCAEIISQRDETLQHLASVENAFSDVHKKYERCKTVIEEFKTNEDSLKKSILQFEETVQAQEKRYEALKSHALVQLEKANIDLDATKRQHHSEQTKLTAMLKKAELKIKSLQESLAQKSTESEELAAICDELINKVGDK